MNPKVILIVIAWFAWTTPTLSAQSEVLTLDQAINISLRDNRHTKNARFEVDKATEKLAATRTQLAFLGVVSLVGVIVSHIIVLFDFIEEKHAEGEPLIEALLMRVLCVCVR